ncbi:MAG: hypothetical protein MJ135_00875, partial [Oscillospiraceae bacterium]|nr:hypothetical protein [Oscillospiraceae bacterium]
MSYGNGATVEYAYDELERVTDVYYNGSVDPALHYSYTGEGAVGSLTDHRTGREYSYVYDSLGRLNGMTERENGTEVQSYTASYDTANRLVSAEYSVSPDGSGTITGTRSTACSYEGSDGKLSAMTSPAGSFSYAYDGLKRLAEKELTGVSTEEFTYCAGQEAGTTTLLAESKRTKKADGSTVSEYTYTYDALGNITAISGSTNAAYTYDNQSQLLSETLEGITT